MPDTALPLTGERTLPGVAAENYWFRRHEAAYDFVAGSLDVGVAVLEVGAGEGYGAARLAADGRVTVALDYDALAIEHLSRRYPQVRPVRGNLARMPFRAQSFDAAVSMQVIEHVWFPGEFLAECHRVLRPGGRLMVSTPNRLTFSPGLPRGQKPRNPFHVREFDADELVAEVEQGGFEVTGLLGLHASPRLARLDRAFDGGLVAAQLASDPERWPPELVRAVDSVGVSDFVVRDGSIADSLDLIVLAERPVR